MFSLHFEASSFKCKLEIIMYLNLFRGVLIDLALNGMQLRV